MSPLLVEGDIRAPEVWLRVDTHDRRASPIDVPEPLPRVGDALAVAVGCYAGARGDETPRRFTRGDQLVEILAVVAQWRTPDHWYFRVATGIGKLHQSDAQDGGSKAVAISTNTSSACTIPATDTKRKTMLNSTIERRLTALIVLLPTLLLGLGIQRAEAQDNERFPYETLRSPAMGLRGVVATSQPLAANAGLDILKKGGNAIDAAVATAAVLTLVEPNSTSLGGDAFIMIYIAAEKKLVGINASGRAPYSMTLDALNVKLDQHGMNRISGIYSVSVPGAVDGWFEVLEEYGTMTMAEVLEPAIYYAEHGFPVSPIIAAAWRGLERSREPSTRAALLLDGERAPRAGEVFRNPDLAHTFRMLAAHGRDAFYKGPIAEAIVAYSDQHDGFLTMKDFADHTSTWVEPIFADYENYRLYELPPNGQGIAALEMIKILGNVDLGAMGHNSAAYLHHIIEAKKLAYADIQRWNGDPEFNHLPTREIISTEYARRQFERIDPTRAMERPESGISGNGDTILLEVMDKDHNAVSFIYSIYSGFGSGLVAPGTGFPLQNRAALFSREPGHINVVEPHKRPFHTIIPAMAFKDGEFFMTFGAMGGAVQPQQHVQIFLNVVEFGMNAQQAVEIPRINHQGGLDVTVEPGIDEAALAQLEAWGHQIRRRTTRGGVGGAQLIMFDRLTGAMIGGSTPHKDGLAVVY